MPSDDIIWHNTTLHKMQRAGIKNQTPCVLWLTGLSASGKSSLANALELELYKRGFHTYLLDGDNVRLGLNKDLGFDEDSRIENIRRIGELCKLFIDSGLIVLTAFISPFQSDRDMARSLLEANEFVEIFVDVPLSICEQRDPKGLYKKARDGEIKNFTGITSPYEIPSNPEIHLKNFNVELQSNVEIVMQYLIKKGYIHA